MGRLPATSDVDCTVSYRCAAVDGAGPGGGGGDLLDASVQILLITECIVLDVYSRRKVSLQLTEGISRQLRDWSARWLPCLKRAVASCGAAQAVGACQVMASYYYAAMLVSRPFLMYEVCRRLSDGKAVPRSAVPASGRSKLADACIDAASLMVDSILDLIAQGLLDVRVPLMVSVSPTLPRRFSLVGHHLPRSSSSHVIVPSPLARIGDMLPLHCLSLANLPRY